MTAAAVSASRPSCSLRSTPAAAGGVDATAAVRAGRGKGPSWLTPSAAAGPGLGRSIGSVSPTSSPPPSPLLSGARIPRWSRASEVGTRAALRCPGSWHGTERRRAGRSGSNDTLPHSTDSAARAAVPPSWHGCQEGAKKPAQVPFSLARDNGRCPRKDLAEDRRTRVLSVSSAVGLPPITAGYPSWALGPGDA